MNSGRSTCGNCALCGTSGIMAPLCDVACWHPACFLQLKKKAVSKQAANNLPLLAKHNAIMFRSRRFLSLRPCTTSVRPCAPVRPLGLPSKGEAVKIKISTAFKKYVCPSFSEHDPSCVFWEVILHLWPTLPLTAHRDTAKEEPVE